MPTLVTYCSLFNRRRCALDLSHHTLTINTNASLVPRPAADTSLARNAAQIFDRESSREKIVVGRLRELNLKKRSRSARVQLSSAKSNKGEEDKGEVRQ